MTYVSLGALGATVIYWAPGVPARPLLKRGSKGSAVREAQRLLNSYFARSNVGISLVVDGDFGRNTEEAVKNFQQANKDASGTQLVVDGQIGRRTWSALIPLSFVPSSAASGPSAPPSGAGPGGPPAPQMQVSGGTPIWVWPAVGVLAILALKAKKR